jgi:DDE superfamily endonuclease
MTGLPNKNCETIAPAVPGTSEHRWQEFRTNRHWDEDDLQRQRVQKVSAEATLGDGGVGLDDTGFPNQGKTSVGGARQDSGTWGKVGNCQLAVTCCDSDPQASGPVAVRLYLPRAWAADPHRRENAHVPVEMTFQTKPELALLLLDQACAWGVPHRGVVAEADYGDHPNFLAGLERRQARSGVGGRADFRGSPQRSAISPVQRADHLRRAGPRWQWRTIRWRQGAKGGVRQEFVAVRCWRVTSDGQRQAGWLRGERARAGSRRSGNTPGVTCRRRPRWRSWRAMSIVARPSNSSTKRPQGRWAGIKTRAGCGLAFTGMRPRSCWPPVFWCGWSCGRGGRRVGGVAHAPPFPPRPARRRATLAAIPREVARWLRHQAVLWWVTTDRFIDLCSRRF